MTSIKSTLLVSWSVSTNPCRYITSAYVPNTAAGGRLQQTLSLLPSLLLRIAYYMRLVRFISIGLLVPLPHLIMTTSSVSFSVYGRLRKLFDSDDELKDFMSGSSQLLKLSLYSRLICGNANAEEQPCNESGILTCSKVGVMVCLESIHEHYESNLSSSAPYKGKILIAVIRSTLTLTPRQYCSKKCQSDHWRKHRQDCKHAYLKADWQPAWVRENRPPAFLGGPPVDQFGKSSNYLWGNVSAIDCLNVLHNEGLGPSTTDFKLCFAGKCRSHSWQFHIDISIIVQPLVILGIWCEQSIAFQKIIAGSVPSFLTT
jgi:hypothetical protein